MKKNTALFSIIAGLAIFSANAEPAGYVIGWGRNESGQATAQPYSSWSTGTVVLAGQKLTGVKAIAAGTRHSLALKDDGTVVSWGVLTNVPISLANVVAIAAAGSSGIYSLFLRNDGRVVTWSGGFTQAGLSVRETTDFAEASDVVGIAVGGVLAPHSLALRKDGTVLRGKGRQDIPIGLSNVVAIAAGGGANGGFDGAASFRSFALKRDGTVVAWGSETSYRDLLPPPGLNNIKAISAGGMHCLALLSNGTVMAWGFNRQGEATGVPTPTSSGVTNGLVIINGQQLSDAVAVAAGTEYNLALKKDGTVVGWGMNSFNFGVPAGLSNVVAIAAGDNYCLAITTNSAVAENFMH